MDQQEILEDQEEVAVEETQEVVEQEIHLLLVHLKETMEEFQLQDQLHLQ